MKNTNLLIGAAVLCIIVLIAFLFKAHVLISPFEVPALNLAKEEPVNLFKPAEKSKVKGTALILEENGKAKVLINATGFPKDQYIYMHIHEGKCPDLGEIVYDLNTFRDGVSETILDVGLDKIKKDLPLGINIHTHEGDLETELACADIK